MSVITYPPPLGGYMSLLEQIQQLLTGYAIGVFILVLLAVVGIVRQLEKENRR